MCSPGITFKAQLQAGGRLCRTLLVFAVTLLSVTNLCFIMSVMCCGGFWDGEDDYMGRGRLGNFWQTLVEFAVFQILLLISFLLPLSHVAHSVTFLKNI